MAIGWLALLKIVPWVDVVRNAPMVVDEAKKLWNSVAKKSPLDAELQAKQSQQAFEKPTIESLQTRLNVIESACAELHKQLLASTELIKALAEQNTQLVKRVETNRLRLLWLAAITLLLGVVAAVKLF